MRFLKKRKNKEKKILLTIFKKKKKIENLALIIILINVFIFVVISSFYSFKIHHFYGYCEYQTPLWSKTKHVFCSNGVIFYRDLVRTIFSKFKRETQLERKMRKSRKKRRVSLRSTLFPSLIFGIS